MTHTTLPVLMATTAVALAAARLGKGAAIGSEQESCNGERREATQSNGVNRRSMIAICGGARGGGSKGRSTHCNFDVDWVRGLRAAYRGREIKSFLFFFCLNEIKLIKKI